MEEVATIVLGLVTYMAFFQTSVALALGVYIVFSTIFDKINRRAKHDE